MVYLGLSLFLLIVLYVLRKPLAHLFDWSGRFLWRAAVGILCLYVVHLTASYTGSDWYIPINYFTAGFTVICGVPGVLGIVILSFLL
uniref:pro-sigmaK processing inhibitor BofA family protein n=1 Tax=Chryseomicrobium sp. FSL W7-1435 TaxID=2921704 RepID=UPI00406D3EF9